MNITARKYERRKKAQQQHKALGREQINQLLTRANKAVKSVKPRINMLDLGPEAQASILAAYADQLEIEVREFEMDYPDDDGRSGSRWIRMERSLALRELAKLRVQIAKRVYEPV